MISDNSGDTKQLFKEIDKALHGIKDMPLPEHDSKPKLANKFNNFYGDKIDKIRAELDKNPGNPTEFDTPYHGNPLSDFKLLTMDDVRKLINKSNNKSCVLDALPTILIKDCINELLPILTEIINTSLQLGNFIEPLKHAIIKPLLKKIGLELTKNNYRPVSNLSFISKLIEAAVFDQYTEHLSTNNLMDDKQSAYKKEHSTETLLMKVQNEILTGIDNGEVVMLVLLDLSAAFDTIDHNILFERLENMYGIKGTVLKWFKSYLTDRTQSTVIDTSMSDKKTLKYGVPQGSKLCSYIKNESYS